MSLIRYQLLGMVKRVMIADSIMIPVKLHKVRFYVFFHVELERLANQLIITIR
jgi:hypothetical protein